MEHKVEEVKLKCGAKGLLIDVPESPVYCMEIWFRAGDATVRDPKRFEAAHIMEHMACGANAQHDSMQEVSRYIEKNGAYSNAFTGRDYLGYERVCPDFDWERILEQLVIQVTTPKFLENEFKAEVGNVEEEMQFRSNDKWTELTKVMGSKFGFKYSDTYPERLEKMKAVRISDIREHYARTHSAKNAVFFVAGNIGTNKKKIIGILEGMADLPDASKFKLCDYPIIKGFSKPVVINKEDIPNIYLYCELFALDRSYEQREIESNLAVLNKVLSDGDHSRIYGKARQGGLAYVLGCQRTTKENGHYSWSLYCQVGSDNIDKLLEHIVKEVKLLIRKGLKRSEVEEAITSIKGGLRMDNQTAGSILNWNAGWYTSHEKERVYNFEEVDSWYDDITPESIQELFLNLIKTKKWGAGFLGNVTEIQANKWNKKLAEIFED